MLTKVRAHLGTGDVQERADQALLRHRQNRSETGGACAPQKSKQHGFSLVVLGVTGGDAIDETGGAQIGEMGEAGPSGVVLGRANGNGGAMERQSMRPGERGNEASVLIGGLATELVIQVNDGKVNAAEGGKMAQDSQQTDRVGAARDGNANAVPRTQHAITSENSLNSFEQAIL